ncbi:MULTISPECIES: peptide chain release factor 2 [unclassified Clostridium]|uniref:peptide chain release factor 2 n=1 Tax=unclassified Clostridium TaxID=2614128 RepID=UPI0011062873|nr:MULTISPECIES: peptide chain release factor 2 [unclassified Clostridium]
MILELDNDRQELVKIRQMIKEAGDSLDLAQIEAQLEKLEGQMTADGFWDDVEHANKVSQQVKGLKDDVAAYRSLVAAADDIETMIELSDEEQDASMLEEITSEMQTLRERVEKMQLQALLSGSYDANDAILSLHAGAGGTEAQDWCSMLFRMYTRYCERKGYTVKVLDMLDGDEAGIKSVTMEIQGRYAYGYLKAEKGVHRLVRISPFDSSARRHTSFASLDVSPVIEANEGDIEINPEDLKVDTYRSSGAGGQHVNKTESAIRITHIPTGIVVACQNERSQIQNRETAMRMLRSKLMELRERERMEQMAEIKGEMKKIEWGSQIRSYVFQPYTMVKDHRTGAEVGNVDAVMDGELDIFIQSYLKML